MDEYIFDFPLKFLTLKGHSLFKEKDALQR